MSIEKKQRQLIRDLTGEQLTRVCSITPENYNWSNFYSDGYAQEPGRCIAGHAFDLSLEHRTLGGLSEEDKNFARELSTNFCFTPVEQIQELARKEAQQRDPILV